MKSPKTTLLLAAISIILAATITSCSSVNPDSPFSYVDSSGKHPDGWYTGHGTFAMPDGIACLPCHGEDLLGGVTGVSCSTGSYNGQGCHANGPGFHPDTWLNKNDPAFHGSEYSSNSTQCLVCHDPAQPTTAPGYNCLQCHFNEGGTQFVPIGPLYSHGDTTEDHEAFTGTQADVCTACHEVNNRFGNEPFCHNCHETHPDPDWNTRALHGVEAKRSPGSMAGFEACVQCHGDDYAGGSGVTCLSQVDCHNVDAPHPTSSEWKGESTPTHTNTSQANAPECFKCHEDGANSGENPPNPPAGTDPGCYNNTLCHEDED